MRMRPSIEEAHAQDVSLSHCKHNVPQQYTAEGIHASKTITGLSCNEHAESGAMATGTLYGEWRGTGQDEEQDHSGEERVPVTIAQDSNEGAVRETFAVPKSANASRVASRLHKELGVTGIAQRAITEQVRAGMHAYTSLGESSGRLVRISVRVNLRKSYSPLVLLDELLVSSRSAFGNAVGLDELALRTCSDLHLSAFDALTVANAYRQAFAEFDDPSAPDGSVVGCAPSGDESLPRLVRTTPEPKKEAPLLTSPSNPAK